MLQSVSRNVNILYELNASNALSSIDNAISIYQPSTINPENLVDGAKYSGFITGLRVIVNIKSIAEFIIPESNPTDTEEEARLRERDATLSSPRMCLALYLKNSESENLIPIGEILLFNKFPYYYISLIPYFSDNNTFDVAPDTTIAVKMKNVGYEVLKDDDVLTIVGSAIEEAVVSTPSTGITRPSVPETQPPDPDNEMANWQLVSISNSLPFGESMGLRIASAGQKLAIDSITSGLIIVLPEFPEFGDEIKLIKFSSGDNAFEVDINVNGNRFDNGNPSSVYIPDIANYQEVSLIFTGAPRGWIANRQDVLAVVYPG